ncbi:MAG TPA: response regulator [candidate division Zixibacteria bacterium]|jgi:CheY-like chemotaxis protein
MPTTGRKILVVEDNPNMSSLLADMLEVFAIQSVRAVDGRDALSKVDQHDFAMVITDMRMPKMTGTELLVRLKEKRPDMPVVLISGFSLADADDQAAVQLADGFLSKPFRMNDIRRILEQHFTA